MERKLNYQQIEESQNIKMTSKKNVYVAEFKIQGNKIAMMRQDDKCIRD